MKLRTVTGSDVDSITTAIRTLRFARDRFRTAGARKAARAVARALKSADGALRHARRCAVRTGRMVNA